MKQIISIDGGRSGEIVTRHKDGRWEVHRVAFKQEHKRWKLDIEPNLSVLQSIAEAAGGMDRVFVVYERSHQNDMFGAKNSFTNGQNDEFWRVLLTLGGFGFVSVDHKTWQAYCFKGVAGPKSKAKPKTKARRFARRNVRDLAWLKSHNKAERLGIIDAMCIGFWAQHVGLDQESAVGGPDDVCNRC